MDDLSKAINTWRAGPENTFCGQKPSAALIRLGLKAEARAIDIRWSL